MEERYARYAREDRKRADNSRLLDIAIDAGLITPQEVKADRTGQECRAAIELATTI